MYYLLTWIWNDPNSLLLYTVRNHFDMDEIAHKKTVYCSMEHIKLFNEEDVLSFIKFKFNLDEMPPIKEHIK